MPSSHRREASTQRVKILKFINEDENGDDFREESNEIKAGKKRRKSKKVKHNMEKLTEATITTQTPKSFTTTSPQVASTIVKSPKRSKLRKLAEIEELEGEEELKIFEATSTTQAYESILYFKMT